MTRREGGSESTLYLHADHLGSIDAVTDSTGKVVQLSKRDPYGNRVANFNQPTIPTSISASSNKVRLGFTGQEQDDELGLINMRGRMYDPRLGRFLSPDPYVGDPFRGLSWNRYSYVQNRPLKTTDPSGFCDADSPQPYEYAGNCYSYEDLQQIVNNSITPDAKILCTGYSCVDAVIVQQPKNDNCPTPSDCVPSTDGPSTSGPGGDAGPSGGGSPPTNPPQPPPSDKPEDCDDKCDEDPAARPDGGPGGTDGGPDASDGLKVYNADPVVITGEPSWLMKAEGELGVQEGSKTEGPNPRITEYFQALGGSYVNRNDRTAWCAAFANWALSQDGDGYATSGSGQANSFGTSSNFERLDGPILGAIAVVNNGTHATIVAGVDANRPGYFVGLGGNQGGSVPQIQGQGRVQYSSYRDDKSTKYYWPKEAGKPTTPLPALDPKKLNAKCEKK